MQREALYIGLYVFIRIVQGMCVDAYRDPRLYTKEASWSVLVPLSGDFVDAAHTAGLDSLLDESEYGGAHRSSLVKCAFGLAAFDVD